MQSHRRNRRSKWAHCNTPEQARDFARSLISHPAAFGTLEHTEKAGELLAELLAERDALAAKLSQAREALWVCERAADMLTAYAELIRRDGASRIDQHHYLPEVEHVAHTLREAAPPPASLDPDDAALAQEPAPAAPPASAPAEPVAQEPAASAALRSLGDE